MLWLLLISEALSGHETRILFMGRGIVSTFSSSGFVFCIWKCGRFDWRGSFVILLYTWSLTWGLSCLFYFPIPLCFLLFPRKLLSNNNKKIPCSRCVMSLPYLIKFDCHKIEHAFVTPSPTVDVSYLPPPVGSTRSWFAMKLQISSSCGSVSIV